MGRYRACFYSKNWDFLEFGTVLMYLLVIVFTEKLKRFVRDFLLFLYIAEDTVRK